MAGYSKRLTAALRGDCSQVTSGATSDLKQATRLARHMVADCGMSDLIGPMHVETLMDEGRSGGPLREQVDQEVRSLACRVPDVCRRHDHLADWTGLGCAGCCQVGRILRESYQRVKDMLTADEQELHTLASALLEHETLTEKDIHAVLDGTFNPASPGGSPPAEGGSVKGGEANEDGMGSEAIPAAASLAAASGLAPPCA